MNEGKRKPIYNSTNSQAAMVSHILLIRWTSKAHFLRYLRVAVRDSVIPGIRITSIVSAEIYLFTPNLTPTGQRVIQCISISLSCRLASNDTDRVPQESVIPA
jgi:hypothetical protein